MPNLKPIVHAILEDYALPWDGTHGVSHWARVLENGLRLAQETGASIEVVQLFAVLHDSRRVNEGVDDGHGKRGADLAAAFRGDWFNLPDADFDLLYAACVGHTDGETDADITIQTCWDADRLDLGRVGICPEPSQLCTMAAKGPDIPKWADERGCFEIIPEIVKDEWGIDLREWAMTQTRMVCDVAHGFPEYWATVDLRDSVLRKPLGLRFSVEELEAEKDSHHLACYRGDKLVGCLILRPSAGGDIQMRQVAVAAEFQGKGIGTALVEYSEGLARRLGYRRMILHARETAVLFYEKLGYAKTGDRFMEVTLPHWEMAKPLMDI